MPGYADVVRALERLAAGQVGVDSKLGDVREAIASLRTEVGGISREMGQLGDKVDRLEGTKASRDELRMLEGRQDSTLRDIKTAAQIEASRMSSEWTRRLDKIDDDFEEIRGHLEPLQQIRWKVVGASSIIAAIVGSSMYWLPRLFMTTPMPPFPR